MLRVSASSSINICGQARLMIRQYLNKDLKMNEAKSIYTRDLEAEENLNKDSKARISLELLRKRNRTKATGNQ